jgi:GNAT superfamily N-acetyltransferase
MPPAVRERRPGDLPVLLAVLQRTHEQEGYPVRAAAVAADWVAPPDELGGWVAMDDGRVLGHVALLPARGPCLPLWTAGAGRSEDRLAVVSRLFTDRTVAGAGTALLEHAVAEAARLGRVAVLEVDLLSPAHGFYLRRGWRRAGTAVQQWGHRAVDVGALVQPGAPSARTRT